MESREETIEQCSDSWQKWIIIFFFLCSIKSIVLLFVQINTIKNEMFKPIQHRFPTGYMMSNLKEIVDCTKEEFTQWMTIYKLGKAVPIKRLPW